MHKYIAAILSMWVLCLSASFAADSYEPDDTYQTASFLALDSAQLNHSINPVGDVDWVTLSLTEATSIVLLTDGAGTDSTILNLYEADGASLIASDNSSGHSMFSRIETSLAPGLYTARAQSETTAAGINNYLIALYSLAPDAYESDDVTTAAVVLQPDTPQTGHSIFPKGDVDYTTFTLDVRSGVLLETSGAYGCQTALHVYPAGSASAVASDKGSGYTAYASLYTVLDAGAYTVRVSSDATVPQYAISLTVTPPDVYEPDDEVTSASVLLSGMPQTGHTIFPAGDVDWSSFTLATRSTVVLETSGASGDTEMWLYEADGTTEIAYDSVSGNGNFSRIQQDLDAGVYAVKVAAWQNKGTIIDYTLALTAISGDAYEPDDLVTSATTLVAGTPQTSHTLCPAADADWVTFTVASETWACLEATGQVTLDLYQADGATLIKSQKGSSSDEYAQIIRILDAGTYTARVTGWTVSTVEDNYEIRLLVGEPVTQPLMAYGPGQAFAGAWSPTTASAVVATDTPSGILLWNADTGALQKSLSISTDESCSVAFSPDGSRIVGPGDDGEAVVWDIATGSVSLTLTSHSAAVKATAWSPDGTMVATGAYDGEAMLWSATTGNEIGAFAEHGRNITAVAFSPDSAYFATASGDDTVKIWSVASTTSVRSFYQHTDDVNAVAWSHDGTMIASGGNDGHVYLWNPITGAVSGDIDTEQGDVTALAFSPSGDRLLVGWKTGLARLYYVPSETVLQAFNNNTREIRSVAFSPNGLRALIVGDDQIVSICDLITGETERQIEGHTWSIVGVAVDSADTRLVTTGAGPAAAVWDLDSGQMIHPLRAGDSSALSAAISPDGTVLATGGVSGAVRLWDMASGAALNLLLGHTDHVRDVGWSPDGAWIATASSDGTARLWNASTGASVYTLEGHTGEVEAIAFSAAGTSLFTAGADGTVRVWDVSTGAHLGTLNWNSPIQGLAISADGTLAAASTEAGVVYLWNPATGVPVRALDAPRDLLRGLAFTQDAGKLVAAATRQAIMWDVTSGAIEKVFATEDGLAYAIALAHNDTRLIAAGEETPTYMWDTGLTPLTALETEQAVSIASDGRFWSMAFDYTSSQVLNTLDAENAGTLTFDMETDHWCGVYLFDYASGAYSRGFYALRQDIAP